MVLEVRLCKLTSLEFADKKLMKGERKNRGCWEIILLLLIINLNVRENFALLLSLFYKSNGFFFKEGTS